MSPRRSAARPAVDDNLHPIHRADRRLAEIRRDAERVLLGVAAGLLAAPLTALIVIMVRP